MSTNEATVDEYELVEVIETKRNPYRRALEISSLVAALSSFVLVLSAIAQTYTVASLPASAGAGFTLIAQYLAGLLASPQTPLLAFVAVIIAAVVRAVWIDDPRSHNKTITSATVAIVVALVCLVATMYGLIYGLINGDSQFGDSVGARLTAATTNLSSVLLSAVTIAVGVIFAVSRSDREEVATADEVEVNDVKVDDVPVDEAK